MTLTKAERKYLEYLFARDIHGDSPLPKGVGPATILSCRARGLVRFGAFGDYPTALGRFVAEPLEWQMGEHRITADFPGGFAIVHTLPVDRGKFNWGACVRGRWSQEPMAATAKVARIACEAWVDAERLRVAGEDE